MKVRTRFAPSPTGYLHIGGARTALYSWLFARKHQGTFILRIEDTDLERSTPESVDAILKGMEWLGLDYDEGPFYQTKRFDRYKQVLQHMLEHHLAYRCYCSKERLEKLREEQLANKQKPRYDGHCRDLNRVETNEPYVIRFRNPQEGEISFDDQVRGLITVKNEELDDLILARSDGVPTYNFTVVVDDWDMEITHVIRGDDHINNTPRQINILKALGAELPIYAHVPMILGSDGKRLSKRHGAVSVLQYQEEGYLPDALINYLLRLGWSHGDQEIFSREEMIQLFNTHAISRSPAAFNPEKLLWLNQHYLKTDISQKIEKELSRHFQLLEIDISKGPALSEIILAQNERCKTLVEMAEKSRCFYQEKVMYDEQAVEKNLTREIVPALQIIKAKLADLNEWTDAAIHQVIHDSAAELELKLGKIAQPLRVAVTGNTISPPIDITLRLLGKEKTLNRLESALNLISK